MATLTDPRVFNHPCQSRYEMDLMINTVMNVEKTLEGPEQRRGTPMACAEPCDREAKGKTLRENNRTALEDGRR